MVTRLERKGYKLKGMKLKQTDRGLAEEHYKELADKPFYPKLISYITSGPVCAMVWEGNGVVEGARQVIGATKPLEAAPGTIRADFAIDVGRNIVHGSDSQETAEREIALWFDESELIDWSMSQNEWIYE